MLRRLTLSFLLLMCGLAYSANFVEGKDYEKLRAGASSKTPIEIKEFFSYGCPWCYKLSVPLEKWAEQHKKNVRIEKVPVVFHKEWQLYAKAFYTAKLLGIEEKMSPVLFKAIQEDKKPLSSTGDMIAFFVQNGVDKTTATSAFNNSPTIDMALRTGVQQMAAYRVKGVPAVVVNGQYKTDLQMAQSVDRFFAILDYLVAKEQTQ